MTGRPNARARTNDAQCPGRPQDKHLFGTMNEAKSLPIMYALVDIDIKMTRNDNIIPTPPRLPENPQTRGQKRSKTKKKQSTQPDRRETRRKEEKVFRWLAPLSHIPRITWSQKNVEKEISFPPSSSVSLCISQHE